MQVTRWTGREAASLQAALRLTNEAFAEKLGVATRTVANWHKEPDVTPRSEIQQILDTAIETASRAERARFTANIAEPVDAPSDSDVQALQVAIAVVVRRGDILVVCRRTDDESARVSWQFAAGVVKPGASAANTAVRETLSETGITCTVREKLGSRVHPATHVFAEYYLCDYLAGEAENRDPVENADVVWAPVDRLTDFIPVDAIYPPVIDALEGLKDDN